MSVSLRLMRDDEFADWLPEMHVRYSEDMVRNAGIEPEQAAAKAAADMEQLFPGGRPSSGQLLFVVEAEGNPVGSLWLFERKGSFHSGMFVYHVWIDEQHRGNGYGKEAMLLAEEESRQRGLDKISLNVFGGNTAARALYASLGYEENAVSMSKRL